ncbi:hypothetical protein QCA50_007232 [Cerrena zonata]|uniref:Cytochrome P450 n=1 Tax=Cerrena zonata TaxID=2478898 RepID=A0AAW0GK22_9APHY
MYISTLLWAVAVFPLLWKLFTIGSRAKGLPPGPSTVPLLGNLHQFPTKYTRIQFSAWAKEYGKIFSLKIIHGTTIVITSPRIIQDFMDRRSASTADRPPFTPGEIIMNGLNLALVGAGPTWKRMRKGIQLFLTKEACARHMPIQRAEGIQLMHDILEQPRAITTHIDRQSISIILSTVFGIRTPQFEDSLASRFLELEHTLEELFEPGAIPPVDILPILNYVPERWAPWKRKCRELREQYLQMFSDLRDVCETRIQNNKRNGSYLEDVIDKEEKLGLSKEMVAAIGAACLEAGSTTTSSFLQTFVLCLVHHPHVQQKAQVEIDNLIGTERLPTIEDFEHLPYVQAIVKETHRYFPPIPLGIPHRSTVDEMVDGFLVPKGSTIFMNYYGIYRDPDLFDDPERFNPTRYLSSMYGTKPGVDDTGFRSDLHFGSGRRICPGIHLATNSIKMNVVNLLWAFHFESTESVKRDPAYPVQYDDFPPGIATGPKSFSCILKPRSERHASLIRSGYRNAQPVFEMFDN